MDDTHNATLDLDPGVRNLSIAVEAIIGVVGEVSNLQSVSRDFINPLESLQNILFPLKRAQDRVGNFEEVGSSFVSTLNHNNSARYR